MFFAFTLSSSLGASLLFFYPALSMTSAKKQNSPFRYCSPCVSLRASICKGFVLPLTTPAQQNPTNYRVRAFASAEEPTQNARTGASVGLWANASSKQPTQFAHSPTQPRPLLHSQVFRRSSLPLDFITY